MVACFGEPVEVPKDQQQQQSQQVNNINADNQGSNKRSVDEDTNEYASEAESYGPSAIAAAPIAVSATGYANAAPAAIPTG